MPSKVTDPALLAQLNAPSSKKVTDPAILAQLNGESAPTKMPGGMPDKNPGESNAAYLKRTTELGNMVTGAQESGVDIMKGARWLGEKLYGKNPHDETEKAAFEAASKRLESEEGKGVGNWLARQAGDPLNYALAEVGGKPAIKGAETAGKAIEEGAKTMKMGFNARDIEALDQTVAGMEAKSDAAATQMRKMGVKFNPEMTQALVKHIEEGLAPLGKRDLNLHGETMKVLDDMKAASEKGFDMEDLDIFRKRLRQIANKGGEDGKMAGEALDSIRDAAESFRESLPKGSTFLPYVDQWAQARRFDTLSNIVKKSGGDPQKIKAGFYKLLNDKRKMRGFSKEERDAIKAAAEYTTPERIMRLAGRFGFEIGGEKTAPSAVLPGVELYYGALTHNPYALPFVAGATGARYGAKLLARGKAEEALRAVERRALNADEALGAESNPMAVAK